jgi:hypothetical protein
MRYESHRTRKDAPEMTLLRLAAFAFAALAIFVQPAAAKDCGLPPAVTPTIPDGNTATAEDIRAASQAVQDHGFKVQTYLNCLELNKEDYFLNMTDPERQRWAEDFNALADKLTALETGLNEQIRIYNARQ